MIAVIEGLDRTGKSLLAEWIALEMPGKVIHKGKPTKHPLDEYETDLLKHKPGGPKHLALDRWHVGERVWPEIFGRSSEYGPLEFKHTEMFLLSRGAVLVYCERPFADLLDALISAPDEPDELKDEVSLRRALDLYEDRLADRACPLVRYVHRRMIGPLLRFLHETDRRAERPFSVTDRWIGAPLPSILFVSTDGAPVPFQPRDSYRRETFENAMQMSGEDWVNVAMADTLDDQGRRTPLHSLWMAMARPRVVPLDDEAVGLLHDARVPTDAVQYDRREGAQ